MADSVVSIGADLSALRRDLAKIPNLSGEAAQKSLIALERSVNKAEKAAKKATRSISRDQKRAAREAEKQTAKTREGLLAMYELSGGSGDQINKLGAAFGALASPVGIAAAGIAALTAVVAAQIWGMSKFATTVWDVSYALQGTIKELEDYKGITETITVATENEVAASDRLHDSMAALEVISKQVTGVAGAHLVDWLDDLAVYSVAGGLAVQDLYGAWKQYLDMIEEVIPGLDFDLPDWAENYVDRADRMVRSMEGMRRMEDFLRENQEKTKAVIDAQTAALARNTKAKEDNAKATEKMQWVEISLQSEYAEMEAERQQLRADGVRLEEEYQLSRIEDAKAAGRMAREEAERQQKMDAEMVQAKLDGQNAIRDSALDLFGEITSIQTKSDALNRAFAVAERGRSAAMAVVNTSEGVTKALSSAPPPLNFVNAGLVGAAGAVQVAKIAATPIMHTGGVVQPQRLSPDESMIRAQVGERVLNRSEAREYERSSTIVVQQVYGHQAFDSFVADNVKRAGPLRRALSAQRSTARGRRKR